jgi:TolB protein
LFGVLPAQSSLVHAQSGPNGKIAFVSDRDGARDIYTMNADGSQVTKLTNLGECAGPVWSPDGNRIAFTHRRADGYDKIYRINADGTGLSLLYIEEAWPAHQRDPKWSPDGTKIAFVHEGVNAWNYEWEIYVMDATTGYTLGNYSYDQPFFIVTKDLNPVWSPDGTKLAYLREFAPYNGADRKLFVLDLTTGDRIQLTTNGTTIVFLEWSPNSNRLAFTSDGVGRYARVHVINADGSNLISPTPDLSSYDGHPSWSPDGTRLAFQRLWFDAGSFDYLSSDVSVASPDVLSASPIIALPGTAVPDIKETPSWSPNGSRVTFAGILTNPDSTQQSEIYTVDNGGAALGRLTNNEALDYSPAWQPTQVDNTPAGANVTVNYGQIKLTFENIITPGQTSIQLLDANSFNASLPGGYLLHNNHAYEITTTATFSGAVTISFELFTVAYPEDLARVRVLHGENGTLVDRTVLAPDQPAPQYTPDGSTVYARVTSLSPFVIADLGTQDQTAPNVTATITSPASAAGWYGSDTFVLLRASDNAGGSGVASITYAINGGSDFSGGSSSLTGGIVVNNSEVDIPVTAEGTTTISYFATDSAGNSSPEQTVTLQLDKTAPGVTINTPTEGAVYTQNQVVKANYNCADALSGIATCAGTTANGSNLDTTSTGARSFVVTATDNAGNTMEQTVNYTVQGASSCATDVTNRIRFDADDLTYDKRTRRYSLTVTVTNKSTTNIQGPVSLVIDYLSDYGITLANKSGVTTCAAPLGSPYINLNVGSDGVLKRNEKVTVTLISDPTDKKNGPPSPRVQPRVLAGNGTR